MTASDPMRIHDAHCHFFSAGFFSALAQDPAAPRVSDPAVHLPAALGWEAPGDPAQLADRWVAELDRDGVGRAALMASVPGDEASVAAAVARHPSRFAGLFMVNPTVSGAADRVRKGFGEQRLRCACLFPAMHRFALDDECVTAVFRAAADDGCAVFVHCGMLSVGVRRKLGLPSRFDVRLGNPLAVVPAALAFPDVPVVIPHFGAGFLRETLMAADLAANVHVDTSSSNGWTKYTPGLSLSTCSVRRWPCWAPSASCSAPTRRSSRAGGSGGSTKRNRRFSTRSAWTRRGGRLSSQTTSTASSDPSEPRRLRSIRSASPLVAVFPASIDQRRGVADPAAAGRATAPATASRCGRSTP